MKKFKGLGVEIEGQDEQQAAAQAADIADGAASEKEAIQQLLADVRASVALTNMDSLLRKELIEKGLKIDGDVPKVLIQYLASSLLLLHFEQVHGLIFGSQIALLKKLNEVRSSGRPHEFVAAFFSVIQTKNAELTDWDWERYVGFLKARELVEDKEGALFITPTGGEYLSWIATAGRSEDRAL